MVHHIVILQEKLKSSDHSRIQQNSISLKLAKLRLKTYYLFIYLFIYIYETHRMQSPTSQTARMELYPSKLV